MNHSTTTLCLYTGTAFLASLAGGGLPSLISLTHTRLQTAISFIAGLMLGMALLHLIPHAIEETHSVDRAVAWALGGFLVMFFLQRAFHYHQHGLPNDAASGPTLGAGYGHNHAVVTAPEDLTGATRNLSWAGVSLGLGFHSLLDGLALAAAVTAEFRSGVGLVGLGTALAVILHKPFDAMAVMTLMQSSGCSATLRRVMNITIALIAPLGVALAFLGLGEAAEANHVLLGCALGFCAGDSFASRAATCCPNCTSTRTTACGSRWLCWRDWACPFWSEPLRATATVTVTVMTKKQTNNIKNQTNQT
jgi:zinc and cadmium transporter